MKKVKIPFNSQLVEVNLPDACEVFSMSASKKLKEADRIVEQALESPIGCASLKEIIRSKLAANPKARAVIVVSDSTRPVRYKGEGQILWPVINTLLEQGIPSERITILVATGTHRAMEQAELEEMLDRRVFELGIAVKNHDCHDLNNLTDLGTTSRGTKIMVNSDYVHGDIKILTGLVESHFMAGASGGRKAVCPGLVGEESTFIFHGPEILGSSYARDLVLAGNPCHEEAVEVAEAAGVDFIVNVTLDHAFNPTAVFAGDLIRAHEAAVEFIKGEVAIPVQEEFDIVLSHAGYVGINHYQAAKVGVASIPLIKPGGKLIIVANNTDTDPVGSINYRTVLYLLKRMGPTRFNRLLVSTDWSFIAEQWQVQMWARLFAKTAAENVIYYSPQLSKADYQIIPGVDGNSFLPKAEQYCGALSTIASVLENALEATTEELRVRGQKDIRIAYLADGPYGIPIMQTRSPM